VQHRIKSLDSRHGDSRFLCEFDGRAEISFDFHWPSGGVVLIHGAVGLCRRGHLLDRCFTESSLETAALGSSEVQEFVDDSRDHRTDADFLQQLGMRRRLKDYTGWVEGDRSVFVG
jgi:hypothetical protein